MGEPEQIHKIANQLSPWELRRLYKLKGEFKGRYTIQMRNKGKLEENHSHHSRT